ncbi:MAG: amidohydrolase family protein [Balneolaceae bacterium]|nr:amidohydrolase family protein [Balneolaceae bacterium]
MKAFKQLTLTLMAICLTAGAAIAQIPEKPEFGQFAITGADIYTVTDGVIEGGTVLIDGKTITAVGQNVTVPAGYQRIDAAGKRIYPGFIDAGTGGLGLIEVSAVPVTVDANEIGEFKPHVMAFTAINPHSAAIPVTRTNGITTVISPPGGGTIPGMATLIDLYGNSPDSMAVLQRAALVHDWPSSTGGGWWDNRSEQQIREQYEENVQDIQDYWDRAFAYNEMMNAWEQSPAGKEQPDKVPDLEAMRPVINGEIPVAIAVNDSRDILEVIEWTTAMEERGIRFILAGVDEGWLVADEIAESGLPAVVGPVLSTPSHGWFNYQTAYQNAGKLAEAGVKVAITAGDVENTRNLPFNAGYAATYGMGIEEALKAVTINPAEIFGVGDRLGSIEEGKQANLFIVNGDPFEPLSQVEQVWIEGFKIPMTDRHMKLYEQFLDRGVAGERN